MAASSRLLLKVALDFPPVGKTLCSIGSILEGQFLHSWWVMKRDRYFWLIQGPGWLLLCYLIYAQAIPAFSYEAGINMETQEPPEVVTDVGVAFWYGFAFGDLVTYIPLLAIGLIGFWKGKRWGHVLLGAALGVTIYWPVVCLAAVVAARGASGWNLVNETPYWIVLPLITLWGAWGLWRLTRQTPSGVLR
jgi:hypothetical protein